MADSTWIQCLQSIWLVSCQRHNFSLRPLVCGWRGFLTVKHEPLNTHKFICGNSAGRLQRRLWGILMGLNAEWLPVNNSRHVQTARSTEPVCKVNGFLTLDRVNPSNLLCVEIALVICLSINIHHHLRNEGDDRAAQQPHSNNHNHIMCWWISCRCLNHGTHKLNLCLNTQDP